jgi:hypothetical protein
MSAIPETSTRIKRSFSSLTQAREFRDRRADWALADMLTFSKKETAEAQIQAICQAEGDWRGQLSTIQALAFEHWDGNGSPEFGYLDDMGDAIDYIAAEERAAVEQLRKENR